MLAGNSSAAFSLSPSYPRQEITDSPNDWQLVKSPKTLFFELKRSPDQKTMAEYGQNEVLCKRTQRQDNNQSHFHPPDISSVTYLSDGKTLNATLWLSSPFRQPPPNASEWLSTPSGHAPWYILVYGMSFAVKSVYDTQGADYSISYSWDVLNQTWTRTVFEHSPFAQYKILEVNNNYTLFSVKEKRPTYINLSLDLPTINYPDQYELVFSAYDYFVQDFRVCPMSDITSRVYVPPPVFVISSTPSSVEMRPGEHNTVGVKLVSNADIKSQVLFSTENDQSDGNIKSNFSSNNVSVPINGVVTSRLDIEALEHAEPGSYNIPITSKINITTEAKPRRSIFTGEITSNPSPQNFSQSSSLTVTVLPSLTLPEYLGSMVNTWGAPIKELIGIFTAIGTAGGIAYGLTRWLRKRGNQQSQLDRGSNNGSLSSK